MKLSIGDRVKLISVPEWLTHDLPENDQAEIVDCIGKTALIEDIDKAGYYWIGFGRTVDKGKSAYYSGHSFCVPSECLERAAIE